jgi:periplasmic protein TonB
MPAAPIPLLQRESSRPRTTGRLSGALSISLAVHIGLALLVGLVGHRLSTTGKASSGTQTKDPAVRLMWAGLAGGGGDGGGDRKAPPRQLERLGERKAITIAAASRPSITPSPAPTTPDVPLPITAIDPVESGLRISPGVSAALLQPGDFMGLGSGDGAGNGRKRGNGNGDGNGIGDGLREGIGGGPGGPGAGDIAPVLLREVRPNYTQEGLLARAQGIMRVEAVVMPDGTVGDVRIVGGFEPPFGLDREAVNAVKQWRFVPGRREGRVTPMRVSIELTFTLR